ncbi:hypothetical protein CMK19_11515 [Candidatus Poribacteria bacterium]|mgnify:FL=1|nr:hypothetical protein [Candidatus Poribacteria bacterium]
MNRQQFLQFSVAAFTSLSTGQLQSLATVASSSNLQVAQNYPNILMSNPKPVWSSWFPIHRTIEARRRLQTKQLI